MVESNVSPERAGQLRPGTPEASPFQGLDGLSILARKEYHLRETTERPISLEQ